MHIIHISIVYTHRLSVQHNSTYSNAILRTNSPALTSSTERTLCWNWKFLSNFSRIASRALRRRTFTRRLTRIKVFADFFIQNRRALLCIYRTISIFVGDFEFCCISVANLRNSSGALFKELRNRHCSARPGITSGLSLSPTLLTRATVIDWNQLSVYRWSRKRPKSPQLLKLLSRPSSALKPSVEAVEENCLLENHLKTLILNCLNDWPTFSC